jgi:crotonyl-CoA carboxylase/reductase
MAADPSTLVPVEAEPGELPATMAAWVIREERFGEPRDAFQVEEVPVPEPGAFEVIVRVMAAGVNYNNVWAAMGTPVSVMKYGDHPEFGHHIGGSDGSGVVWKVGPGVTRWAPGDEVVIHCNQASYEDPEVHGLDPMAAPSQRIWGYETTWGSFAQFTKVQAQQLLPKPAALSWEEAASYGLVYFTAWRMLVTRCRIKAGDRVLIWGAAGGLGVFATQICAAAGARSVGVVSSPAKGALVEQLGACGWIDRGEFAGMMRTGTETPAEEHARFRVSRLFAARVRELLGEAPDIVFEHVGRATFPTSVYTVRPFGKVVICAGTTGFNLDFDVRYLWMKQKEILGSHFANAYECLKASELIESGAVRPVLWRTLGFDGVGEAHQLMKDNKHLGKIAILVGAKEPGLGRTADGPGAILARWVPDGRQGGPGPVVRHGLPRRPLRGGARGDRARGAALRRELVRGLPRRRRPLQVPAVRPLRQEERLGRLLGGPGVPALPGADLGLVPGAGVLRLAGRLGPRRAGAGRRGPAGPGARHGLAAGGARAGQPCSSGAIVRPASLSISQ